MTKKLSIKDTERIKKQAITDVALVDIEAFRSDASRAYEVYPREERSLLRGLTARDKSAFDILNSWEAELLPFRMKLELKRNETSFLKQISKQLILTDSQAQATVDQLVDERLELATETFVSAHYAGIDTKGDEAYAKQRDNAEIVFSLPVAAIERLKNHLVDYVLYKGVAAEYRVAVYDMHGPLITRLWSASRINSERQKKARQDKKRLRQIHKRLFELETSDDGLLGEIMKQSWDLIVVLSLRNRYEKCIKGMTKDDAASIVRRLEVFDSETRQFKEKYTESLLGSVNQTSLQSARSLTKYVDTLLLRIFDLTTVQKNQLLVASKEYRELTQEAATLLP